MSNKIRLIKQSELRRVAQKYNKYQMLIVAMSGGPDSTVLFYEILQNIKRKKLKFELAICHVNFCLRGEESFLDEKFIQKVAKQEGVPFFCLRVTEKQAKLQGESIQMWARRVRYEYFSKLALEHRAFVALAHHQDDLAESFLLRLVKGKSAVSLLGMSRFHQFFWRPFLKVSKEKILAFAECYCIQYRSDASNNTPVYDRNKIRLKVLPPLSEITSNGIANLVESAGDLIEMSSWAREQMSKLVAENIAEGKILISTFASLPKSLFLEAMVIYLTEYVEQDSLSRNLLHDIYFNLLEKRETLGLKEQIIAELPARKILVGTKSYLTVVDPS